ncbi:sugar ABC transporter permease [soil metagenome]
MSTSTVQPPAGQAEEPNPPAAPAADVGRARPVRSLIGLAGVVVICIVAGNLFIILGGETALGEIPKLLQAVVAIVGGLGGSMALFFFVNMMAEGFARRWEERVKPYVFLLPAYGLIGLFIVYPTILTINNSFANDDTTAFVGFDNYTEILGDPSFRETLLNNLLWIIIVPATTVFIGLIVAVLADKLNERGEKLAKSLVFLPMAISFVGAATIWKFIYDINSTGEQIGLLNGIVTALGFEPVSWLATQTFQLNDILLMVILIWLQVGFSMVLLSAAIKGVPEETLEAARIDGANEFKIFWLVTVPQIRVTITAVFVTVLILVLKVFDVVYVMNNGRDGTSVIGLDFFRQIFDFGNFGVAAAIVVLLIIAIVPVLIYQIRSFRAEEANR